MVGIAKKAPDDAEKSRMTNIDGRSPSFPLGSLLTDAMHTEIAPFGFNPFILFCVWPGAGA